METAVSFTIGQLLTTFVAVCGGLVTIGGAAAVVMKIFKKFKEPNSVQDKRIKDLETRADKIDTLLDNDNRRILKLETESGLTLRAVLALLKHGINGNDTQAMKESMNDIEYFLVNGKLKH